MGQLTPEDFLRMQREAKMRVAEMQKRSRYYAENSQHANRLQSEARVAATFPEKVSNTADDGSGKGPALVSTAKREMQQKEDNTEMLLLLFLSLLVGEQDQDLFLLLIYIMLE